MLSSEGLPGGVPGRKAIETARGSLANRNRTRLMHYAEALRDGLPIATGVIEGACRSHLGWLGARVQGDPKRRTFVLLIAVGRRLTAGGEVGAALPLDAIEFSLQPFLNVCRKRQGCFR